jgi:thiol-disulfide isomerase/thioredoxin
MYHTGMKNGVMLFWLGIIALVVIGVGASFYVGKQPGKLDALAQCLTDKGVVFYGAFWCPHCQKTKKMFGSSARLLPYVECSTPDGKDQTQICKDKKITSYPTWVFPDGSILNGEHTLQELAAKSGCALP